jgi:hypothetical protein
LQAASLATDALADGAEGLELAFTDGMTIRTLMLVMAVIPMLVAASIGGTAAWYTGDFRFIGFAGLIAAIGGGAVIVASGNVLH